MGRLFAVCGAIVVAVSYTLVAQLGVAGQGRQPPSSFTAQCPSEPLLAHPNQAVLAKCAAVEHAEHLIGALLILARNERGPTVIDNAVQYNIAAGDIWVSTRTIAGSSELTVANTGPVISPAGAPAQGTC